MKKQVLILLLFIFGTIHLQAQTYIKGKVISIKNEPLEGASVYLNNTTVGTITNQKGEFELKIDDGNYNLIISYLGYKTTTLKIETTSDINFLTFNLVPETNILDEVVISKTIYNADWEHNLSRFKRAFLGRSKLTKECKILNEKDLHFTYIPKTNTLKAIAKKPLKIKHNGLGYLINYDLIDFTLKRKQLFFSGYARYKNLRKTTRKKWKKNRLEAYNGSQMHFLRSLISKEIKKEGFIVNQFKRVSNPERPSEKEIKEAKELVLLYNNKIDYSKKITKIKTPLDNALLIIKKSKLPKYRDYLYKNNVPYQEIVSTKKPHIFLDFKNYLMVIYTKEPEEHNYLIGMFGQLKKASGVQTSNIVLLNKKALIDNTGILVNPNAIFNEGYWGFESFSNMLPLNYQPSKY